MSRVARKDFNASFFHVMVQGIKKEKIFKNDKYKSKYIELLKKELCKSNVKVIAYCVMGNHVHLLIYVEKISELSKLMQTLNGQYAQYYNYINEGRVGYVYRDRFLSEPITNQKYLVQCIKYIHLNPVKAGSVSNCEEYKYSSYNEYKYGNKIIENDILMQMGIDIKIFLKNEQEDFEIMLHEDDEVDENKDEIFDKVIHKYEIKNKVSIEDIKKDQNILKQIVTNLKEKKFKYIEIQERLKISEWQMRKLKRDLKKKEI